MYFVSYLVRKGVALVVAANAEGGRAEPLDALLRGNRIKESLVDLAGIHSVAVDLYKVNASYSTDPIGRILCHYFSLDAFEHS